ncbi:MAG: DUF885 family protein [Alphaproteobacteria bacterium]|nr:DUF885 family protein [Alphaproteobacteria bacterium]
MKVDLPQGDSALDRIQSIADDLHAHLTRDPNSRVFLGVDRDLGALPDPSAADSLSRLAEAQGLLEQVRDTPRAGLDFDAALDLDLAALMLEAEIHQDTLTFNGQTRLEQLPTAGADVGDGIFMLFINDPRPAGDRLADITARLEAVPGYLDALLGHLGVPVARWVDVELERVVGLPELFETVRGWAESVSWPDRGRLEVARVEAERALTDYAERLRALPTHAGFHIGDADARRIIALRGIDLSPEQLHRVARDFLARTSESLAELRGRLVPRYGLPPETTVAELHRFLNQRFRVTLPTGQLDDVLDRYREERRRVLDFIRQRDLFPIPEHQEMKILRTPGFMAPSIPAGAMMPPPPFREGVRTSLIYLTLSDELLDEHTELGIPSMIVHEGIPGHHLQLATAGLHPSIIRRHMNAMDQAEGWTTMLEDYMLDVGLMGPLTDEARFIGHRDIARIGARVVIDLFFMTGDRRYLDVGVDCDVSAADPFEAAGSLLAAVTGFTPGRTQAELNWYSIERGYPLSYLAGNHLVHQLKADVTAACAGRLEGLALDRAFHRTFLEAGNMPVRFLRAVFAHEGLL